MPIIKCGGKIVTLIKKNISCIKCPECEASTILVGPILKCSNSKCQGTNVQKIMNWIIKRNIMHLGEESLNKLIEIGKVKSIPNLYQLVVSDFVDSGIGEKMGKKILDEIDKSRYCTIFDMIGSLSLDMLGRSEAENIYDLGYKTLEDFLTLKKENLIGNKGYGEIKADRIVNSIQKNRELLKEMDSKMTISKPKTVEVIVGKLSGKAFCFTGAASLPRKELQEMVSNRGGTNASAVTKGLDYLVMADPESQSSKAVKARSVGIKIISEEEFFKMCGK